MKIPENMVHVSPLHALDVVKTVKPSDPVHLIEIDDPVAFAYSLPLELQTPSVGRSNAGLPPNIWCGVVLDDRSSFKRAEELLTVRARVLWVYFNDVSWIKTIKLFVPWRCSRCGTRGGAPRPRLCPRASKLCGDARLESQIHWCLMDRRSQPLSDDIRVLGGRVWPDEIPEVHDLEFSEAARQRAPLPPGVKLPRKYLR